MNIAHRAGLPLGRNPPLAGHARALFSRLLTGLETLGARFVAWRAEAADIRSLLAFSDRELHDVGVYRCDIPAIIRGEYRRD
jgi:uncharacterized protein YjiS (DUF1127 family)